jgi:hypothetical protein
MKGKIDWFYIALIVLFLVLLYRMSQPAYWEYKQKQAEANRALFQRLLGKEGFRGGFGAGVGGSGAAYQEIGFADLEKKKEAFRGGFGAGVGGSGAAYQEIGFADLEKKKESFRGGGGGGEGIGARTGGSGTAYQEIDFQDMTEEDKKQLKEAFQNISPSEEVQGSYVTPEVMSPAPASLKQPRKPYNLLQDLPPAPRGSISCLKASCCAETDFEWRTNLTGNYLQRTNNYKREFPDNCTGPRQELTLAFYNPTPLQKV